jgi:phosphopantetheine--protein transferase-like protein
MSGGLVVSHDIIREIIATFLKVDIRDVNSNTQIDKKAIQGSILVHRMYSELKKNGYEVNNPGGIKTFGDLEKELLGLDSLGNINIEEGKIEKSTNQLSEDSIKSNGIGIDIESSANLPNSDNFIDDQFYIDNFSKSEIAYCSSQQNPKSCFTGRFAAKEAIVKANNDYINTKFSNIEITIGKNGEPLFEGMNISISHIKINEIDLSTAVAQKIVNFDIN